MKRKAKLPFDPKAFLSKVNGGRAISDYRKDQIVYTQGESADSVFYIRSGKSRRPSSPSRGRKPWSQFWEPAISLGKGV
jgi:CRP/FNR family transcriptional regulator, cyclic AMP receptor protein